MIYLTFRDNFFTIDTHQINIRQFDKDVVD